MSGAAAKIETSDIPAKRVAWGLVGLFAAVASALALVALMFLVFTAMLQRPPHTALEATSIPPPEPRLEADLAGDHAAIEAGARARLDGYAWTDRQSGRARIPIGRAMAIVADQGWTVPSPPNAPNEASP